MVREIGDTVVEEIFCDHVRPAPRPQRALFSEPRAVCMSLGPTGAGTAKCFFIVIIGMVENQLEARGVPFEPFEC